VKNVEIREIHADEEIPYELLLDADPSRQMINSYLPQSKIYLAILGNRVIGTYVLQPVDNEIVELKNIAVAEEFQNKGVGTMMIRDAEKRMMAEGYTEMQVGTSNASIWQLYLYQKLGFEIHSIKHNFFIDHYPGSLFENGIRVRHMIMLKKTLQP